MVAQVKEYFCSECGGSSLVLPYPHEFSTTLMSSGNTVKFTCTKCANELRKKR